MLSRMSLTCGIVSAALFAGDPINGPSIAGPMGPASQPPPAR